MATYELEEQRHIDPTNLKEYCTMLAAQIDVAYMSKWLTTKNQMERTLLEEIAHDVVKQRDIMRHNLAVEIANEVGKLFSK